MSIAPSPPSPSSLPAFVAPAVLRFGRAELQPRERRLFVDREEVPLGGRAFDLLLALAARPGQLLSKHELMERVWPGLVVEEGNLATQISSLRKALGGDVIATIPGRGYRFVATLHADAGQAPPTALLTEAQVVATPKLKTNLPGLLTPLIGREDDLTALHAMLDRHRLVTIAGAGGMGKTLLAQHVLVARGPRHAQGVCWVELAAVGEAASVPAAIAGALGVRAAGADALAALGAALAPMDLLVALDNAEHLPDAVAQVVAALLDTAPGVHVLVTSQAPLKLAAERVLRLGPLPMPDARARGLDAAQAASFGAVALFVERARAVDARYALTDANVGAVVGVCRALDGMALAIELAAARAPALGERRLAAAMQQRLRLLTVSRNRHAPQRQQTLRATLDWSHALLEEREQAVFRRLAVIAGSASLELVQQVACCARWNEWDVLDALDTLIDRSLVSVVDASGPASGPRYRLLETPRALARELLDADGEGDAVRLRHAEAMKALLDAMSDERDGGTIGADTGLALARREVDNARDAFDWARGAGRSALALGIGHRLLRLLTASALVKVLELSDACESLITPDLPPELQAQVWSAIAWSITDARMGRALAAARHALDAARRIAPEQPQRDVVLYRALCEYASITAASTDDPAAARAAMEEALQLERPHWSATLRCVGATMQFRVTTHLGNPAEAARQVARSLVLQRAGGGDTTSSRIALVDMQISIGDPAAAVRTGRELIADLEGSRDLHNLAFVRLNLAAAHLALDETDAARSLLSAGWSQIVVFDFMTPYLADYMALLAALEGRPEAVVRLLGYADARYAAFQDSRQPTEAAAVARSLQLAQVALDDPQTQRLMKLGAEMSDADAGTWAFGPRVEAPGASSPAP